MSCWASSASLVWSRGARAWATSRSAVADEAGVGADGLDEDAGGQQIAADVEDVAAAGFEAVGVLGEASAPPSAIPRGAGPAGQPGGSPARRRPRPAAAPARAVVGYCSCFAMLIPVYQPPVPIGSSSDGVTGGGKNSIITARPIARLAPPHIAAPRTGIGRLWPDGSGSHQICAGCGGDQPQLQFLHPRVQRLARSEARPVAASVCHSGRAARRRRRLAFDDTGRRAG